MMLKPQDGKAWTPESPLGRDVPIDKGHIFWILHKQNLNIYY